MIDFVAFDVEVARHERGSMCSIALVEVRGRRIVERHSFEVCPSRPWERHRWAHCPPTATLLRRPRFDRVWPRIDRILRRADFVAAHYASFDISVLRASCRAAAVAMPPLDVVCTVELARRVWDPPSARLPDVCALLGIDLDHHNPRSDAEACAKIVLAAGPRNVARVMRRSHAA